MPQKGSHTGYNYMVGYVNQNPSSSKQHKISVGTKAGKRHDPKAILESDEREIKYSSKESKISGPTTAKWEDWI